MKKRKFHLKFNKIDLHSDFILIHGTQFQVVSVNCETPPKQLQGYKDTVSVELGDRVKIAVRFEKEGIYMYHCHILENEDNGMMCQIKVES